MARPNSRSSTNQAKGAVSSSEAGARKRGQAGKSPPALSERNQRQSTASDSSQEEHEKVIPVMLRPKESVKLCAEAAANQIGKKRSQVDEEAYLIGMLLMVLKNRRKADVIGTYSRHQAAECLESVFEGLFELLYEQGMLPLAHQLLIERGGPSFQGNTYSGSTAGADQRIEEVPERHEVEQPLPSLSKTAKIAFQGMPGGTDGF